MVGEVGIVLTQI